MYFSIFGTGYVGLVSRVCLAEVGHQVVCMNVNPVKIEKLKTAIRPIWEPGLQAPVERNYGKYPGLTLCGDKYVALQGAAALVICTEWQQFRLPDFAEMATRMRCKVILDGKNLYQPNKLQAEGWTYFCVGRTTTSNATTHRMAETLDSHL